MQPVIVIESYTKLLPRPAEAAKKAWVFIKDNQQNMLDDSSFDSTNSMKNGNSNRYDQIASTSSNINF